ncbi:MAG: cytotoxin [Bacteroidetes bacterium]|nr:cytotoxin [Bacteroidota bacterium]
MIYEVDKTIITLLILGIGKRNRNEIYNKVFNKK